ncbi:MAG: hypothetical protein JXA42_00850 [Anaerolineales bacterium]|nr:hypothetical protein [Anaerolineales bacterium]
MKRAVSVSLGSSIRDKRVEIELLGEKVIVERIGTNGDIAKATQLYQELDGKIDAFGVGGIDLWVGTDKRRYPLVEAQKMVRCVEKTPIVDGGGLKNTLEHQVMRYIEKEIGAEIPIKRAMNTVALDRYGMSKGLVEAGYQVVFCDLMFALGIPIPLRSLRQVEILGAILAPIVGRLPISVLYPTGEKQHEHIPKFTKWYDWAHIVAGDCLYIKRHMPHKLEGKTILTNTTTEKDMDDFRQAGVSYLVTTTPRLEGRSFGTNMMEAAMVAVSGKGRPLDQSELVEMIDQIGLKPYIERLND